MFKGSIKFFILVYIFTLSACNESSQTEISYIDLSPSDGESLTTLHPIFKFERDSDNISSTLPCSESIATPHDVPIQITRVDKETVPVMYEINQTVHVPNDCQFEVQFPTLTLQEDVNYTWHVGAIYDDKKSDLVWTHFNYPSPELNVSGNNLHPCTDNMLQSWTFLGSNTIWKTTDTTYFTSTLPTHIIKTGMDDNASARLDTPEAIIFQTLETPIVAGKYYQLTFYLKHEGESDFHVHALAYNGRLHGTETNSNVDMIGESTQISYQNRWIKVTAGPWKATKTFANIAIALIHPAQEDIIASIDRVCLKEIEQ